MDNRTKIRTKLSRRTRTTARSVLSISCCLLLLVGLLAGCQGGATTLTTIATTAPGTTAATTVATTIATTGTTARTTIRVAALKGPTGIGLVKLMEDQANGLTADDYQVNLFGSPDEIVAQLTSKQVDVAALPTNLAAVLYQKTNQQVRLLAINTLGVLYILEKGDTVHALTDLAGKQIVASGKGAVPEYVLNELLKAADVISSATVTYKTEHTEVLNLAASGQADLVMLPEPFVTTLLSKNSQFRIALDLTAEWKKINQATGSSSELSMGCLVVTSDFATKQPQALSRFLDEYQTSVDFVNGQTAEAGALVAKYGIMADATLAAKAIPNCHIVLMRGETMQPALQPFFEILFAANPASVGGKLPDQAFYWIP
jgi:NitT/TauT family transport system substrate-binding protein